MVLCRLSLTLSCGRQTKRYVKDTDRGLAA